MFAKEILFFLIFSPLFVDAIIGGEYVTNPHEYPWMVNVKSFSNVSSPTSCGGVIISGNMILTAAHCVEHGWHEYSIFGNRHYTEFVDVVAHVRIGHSSLDHTIAIRVKSKLIHPKYFENPWQINKNETYDIALLLLSENLKFNTEIQPIALPDEEDFNETNYLDKSRSRFMVAGWGSTFDVPKDFYRLVKSGKWTVHKSKIPKEKYLKYCGFSKYGEVKEFWKCEDNLKLMSPRALKVTEVDYIHDKKEKNSIVIRAMSDKPYIPGICKGDSGGPLMKLDVTSGKYEVVGIVSYTPVDGKTGMQGPLGCLVPMPAIYTRVSAFIPWIKKNMKKASKFMLLRYQ